MRPVVESLEERRLLSLTATYYDNADLTGPSVRRIDNSVFAGWGQAAPDPSLNADSFSVRWTGQVQTPNNGATEPYTFYVKSDDGARLWVNNQLLIDRWQVQSQTEWAGAITLAPNTRYDVRLEYFENAGGANAEMDWSSAHVAKNVVPSTSLFADSASAAPGAPSGLTANVASPTRVNLAWTAGTGSPSSYRIERSGDGGATFAEVAVTDAAAGTTYADLGLVPGTAYTYRVRAYNSAGTSAYTANAAATTSAAGLPTPWTQRDVGLVGTDGSGTYAAATGTFAVKGAGVGTGQTADSLRYVYRTLSGDGQIVARVTGLPAAATSGDFTDPAARAGVMFRDNTTPGSPGSPSAFLALRPDGLPVLETRTAASGATGVASGAAAVVAPYWLKLVRAGSTFTAYTSPDGTTWTQLGSATTISMSATAYVGLAVTSGDYGALAASAFDAVAVTAAAPAVPTAPSGLTATAAAATQVNLAWADNSDNEQGFKVERKTGSGGTYAQVGTGLAGATAFQDTGLTAGTTYFYRVRAYNAGGDSAYATEVSVATPAAPTAVPSAPGTPALSNPTTTTLDVTWTDNSANEQGFKVERKTGAGGTFALLAAGTLAAGVTSFSDTTAAAGTTYYYRVRSYNAAGDSAYTDQVAVTTPPAASTFPAVPGMPVLSNPTTATLDVAWADNSTNETGFLVERATDANFSQNFLTVAAPANAVSVTLVGLAPGTLYYVRVRAANGGAISAYTTTMSAGTALVAPTNPVATAASATQVNLTWTDNSANETRFDVDRSTDPSFAPAQTTTLTAAAGAISLSDTGVAGGTTYYYRVRAANAAGASAYATAAAVTTPAGAAAPAAPGNAAVSSPTVSSLGVTWTDNSADETAFEVQYSTDASFTPGPATATLTTGANAISATLSGLAEGTPYYVRVRATNAAGASAYASAGSAATRLQAPTNLSATAASATQVNLTWADDSANDNGFEVDRSTDPSFPAAGTTTLTAATAAQSDSGLAPGTTYYYRVRAVNGAPATSDYTPVAQVTTPASAPSTPAAPGNLAAMPVSPTEVDLTWSDNSSDETGFAIERRQGAWGEYQPLVTVGAGVTSYADMTAQPSTTYYYRVRAYNDAGQSLFTPGVPAETAPATPGDGLTVSYYDAPDFTGQSTTPATATPATTDFAIDWGSATPAPNLGADTFSAVFTGRFLADQTADYRFGADLEGGARVWVNGVLVVDHWQNDYQPGDTNRDGTVDNADFQTLYANLNKPGTWTDGDFNGDGQVNFTDYQILERNFGTTQSPVRSAGLAPVSLTQGRLYDVRVEFFNEAGLAHLGLVASTDGGATYSGVPVASLYAGSPTENPELPYYRAPVNLVARPAGDPTRVGGSADDVIRLVWDPTSSTPAGQGAMAGGRRRRPRPCRRWRTSSDHWTAG